MCDEWGFEGWNGKWKNSASMFDLSFVLLNLVLVFSCATWSLALVLSLASSGRMVVGEYPLLISRW